MNFHCMEISFPLAWQPPLWRIKPATYIAGLIGHEGPGSLHSYLKQQGLITALTTGNQALARGFGMFQVTLHMTAEGFRELRLSLTDMTGGEQLLQGIIARLVWLSSITYPC
jgi:insulysin